METSHVQLSVAQRDRAVGVLVGSACGDALGAGYEFGEPMSADHQVGMIGGGLGPFRPGEWTDDTSMAIAIAEIASTGADLQSETSLDYIAQRWHWWSRNAKDIGVRTSAVLSTARLGGISAHATRQAAEAEHRRTGRTAGNGSLMRTAPVALAHLHDEAAMVGAARVISDLTHFDPDAADACVLWSAAIRYGVLTGRLDVRVGLAHLPADRRDIWASRIEEAEAAPPSRFSATNGGVVAALQGAWSAIATTPVPVEDPAAGSFRVYHLRLALDAAVRGGGDTDTVAAIAGGLLGAAYGVSAVSAQWRLVLHGWPGLRTRGLVHLAEKIIDCGRPEYFDSTYGANRGSAQHPYDDGVWIGAATELQKPPGDADAIVSLCRVADGHIPAGVTHLDVRLFDQPEDNPNLDFVLLDTVRTIERWRAEGRTVFVHGVDGDSRTSAVAALYGARRRRVSVDQALDDVRAVVWGRDLAPEFRAALDRVARSVAGRIETTATIENLSEDPVRPPRRPKPGGSDSWWPYWNALFPPAEMSGWVAWKRKTTGDSVARRLWEQREHLRRTYESVHGIDPRAWPSRHPGIVLDAVPTVQHAACLGCVWIEPRGREPLLLARSHERSDDEFRNAGEEIPEPKPCVPQSRH